MQCRRCLRRFNWDQAPRFRSPVGSFWTWSHFVARMESLLRGFATPFLVRVAVMTFILGAIMIASKLIMSMITWLGYELTWDTAVSATSSFATEILLPLAKASPAPVATVAQVEGVKAIAVCLRRCVQGPPPRDGKLHKWPVPSAHRQLGGSTREATATASDPRHAAPHTRCVAPPSWASGGASRPRIPIPQQPVGTSKPPARSPALPLRRGDMGVAAHPLLPQDSADELQGDQPWSSQGFLPVAQAPVARI